LITQYDHTVELVLKVVVNGILALLIILLLLNVFYGSRPEDSNTPFTYVIKTYFWTICYMRTS